jgi:hypothetical protein
MRIVLRRIGWLLLGGLVAVGWAILCALAAAWVRGGFG